MRILLVEDDRETAEYAVQGLAREGHSLRVATDGREALLLASCEQWELLIVDRMLPHLDGLALVRMLRAGGTATPVLFLTALGEVNDRVAGLQAGGDDYLVKPFALAELAARVEALGRHAQRPAPETVLRAGDIEIDLLTHTASRRGEALDVQERELRILEYLMRNAGRVVTRAMLLETIWGFHFTPRTNLVESNISRLRAKLGQTSDEGPIETVRGLGYRLHVPGR
ncbi:MAG: response regulator transcription factor [Rhodospirillales bacterium]|nr:response regulator transcription factor [Rhodospirillales bacterium]